ncbi:isoaspartyl peptidase/L-asparaginase family protein [Niabella insulamsoli]|uniref:isoaspartyl peptidase/L-asparaginase family protein n=1 Tax=Niabella insulamsoli TaxID=3144874 RepID=UPI003D10B6B3
MVVHGGAGTILKKNMSAEKEQLYVEALRQSLQAGYNIIKRGGSSVDAVEAAIHILEDNPLFNAGKGAVFTNAGTNELDASIMEGEELKAGAVAGVTTIKNPISAARAVMEKSEHVLMAGRGAERFAQDCGLETVDPAYFKTEDRWRALQRALSADSAKAAAGKMSSKLSPSVVDEKFGTVGCVALDRSGNLAAGTSTGGMTNKKYGRIGDAPIIGAGTYCDNNTAGVSCTGWGEYFIRNAVAKTVCDLIAYKAYDIKKASEEVLKKVADMGGSGGLIILDRNGNAAMPFNTEGMYRGTVTTDGKIEVFIYK